MMEKEVAEKYEILKALRKRYEADVAAAVANIEVYNKKSPQMRAFIIN